MRCYPAGGFTLLELLFVIAIMATIIGIALPITTDAVDALRTQGAARYLAARIINARMDAVKRSRCIALRFEPAVPDYTYRYFADGNHNGVRTADIKAGIDPPLDTVRDHSRATGQHQPHHHPTHHERDRGLPRRGVKCHPNT